MVKHAPTPWVCGDTSGVSSGGMSCPALTMASWLCAMLHCFGSYILADLSSLHFRDHSPFWHNLQHPAWAAPGEHTGWRDGRAEEAGSRAILVTREVGEQTCCQPNSSQPDCHPPATELHPESGHNLISVAPRVYLPLMLGILPRLLIFFCPLTSFTSVSASCQ